MAQAAGRNEIRCHKRPAEDELEGEQRLTKKFGLLHIGQSPTHSNIAEPVKAPPVKGQSQYKWTSESMHLDDTKDRVYIHDLDSELAEIESQENDIAFLPEIEKRLIAIPKSVLINHTPANNEIILYRVPASLSVPEDQDSVRRAILDSRARARNREAQNKVNPKHCHNCITTRPSSLRGDSAGDLSYDGDAMDVDEDS